MKSTEEMWLFDCEDYGSIPRLVLLTDSPQRTVGMNGGGLLQEHSLCNLTQIILCAPGMELKTRSRRVFVVLV